MFSITVGSLGAADSDSLVADPDSTPSSSLFLVGQLSRTDQSIKAGFPDATKINSIRDPDYRRGFFTRIRANAILR